MFGKQPNQTRINLYSQPRYIYALIDPRDNAIRYVGVTKNVYARLDHHVKDTSRMDNKSMWLIELEQQGLTPELEILETINACEDVDVVAFEREKYWIRKLSKSGAPLLNAYGVGMSRGPIAQSTRFGQARTEARLTIAQLSNEARVSKTLIYDIEKGRPVKVELAVRVCNVLSRYLDYKVTYQNLEIKICHPHE
jgi:DNA-binding XRE family transcriptional regulator